MNVKILKELPVISKWCLVCSVLLTVALWIFALLRLPVIGNGDITPLHYNVYLGIDEIGSWKTLLWIPALASAALLVNAWLSIKERIRMPIVSTTLSAASFAISILAAAGIFFALVIN